MENKGKEMAQKLTNKPFVVALSVIVIGVALFMVFTLNKAINNKIALIEKNNQVESQNAQTAETLPLEETQPQNTVQTGAVKIYSEFIKNVYITKDAARIAVTVEFEDEGALLEEHFAPNAFSIDVVPVFCFYINNGTQVKIPGELRLLSDSSSVVYYLSDITDLSNAAAITEELTVTLDNVMINDFNIYLQHKTRDGVGRTILGTYANTVEQFKGLHTPKILKTVEVNEKIKNIEFTFADEFLWLDVYFTDRESYDSLKSNSFNFGLEKGGKLYKDVFIVSEYSSVDMLRLKFDKFALNELLKDMNEKDVTVQELFGDYDIEVWSTDYKTDTPLFCLNDKAEIRENINKSTMRNGNN